MQLRTSLTVVCLFGLLTACGDGAGSGGGSPPDATDRGASGDPGGEMARVVAEVEELNDLREGLAASFLGEDGVEPDQETFASVCKPVGERATSLSSEHGWTLRQMAVRYRNPAHRPDETARRVHDRMESEPGLVALWQRDTLAGEPGLRYFRRITVREACLACHGPKEDRPEFVKEGYPEDRAFGFVPGDLRGVYSAFVPEDSISRPGGRPPSGRP